MTHDTSPWMHHHRVSASEPKHQNPTSVAARALRCPVSADWAPQKKLMPSVPSSLAWGGRSVLCQLAWLIRRDLRCRASMTRRRRSSRIPMSGSPPREPARPATTAPKSPSSLSGASSALGLRSRRERAVSLRALVADDRRVGLAGAWASAVKERNEGTLPGAVAILAMASLRTLVADDRRTGLVGASAVKERNEAALPGAVTLLCLRRSIWALLCLFSRSLTTLRPPKHCRAHDSQSDPGRLLRFSTMSSTSSAPSCGWTGACGCALRVAHVIADGIFGRTT